MIQDLLKAGSKLFNDSVVLKELTSLPSKTPVLIIKSLKYRSFESWIYIHAQGYYSHIYSHVIERVEWKLT